MSQAPNISTSHPDWEKKFNHCLALEFAQPDYFPVHHLLVLAYTLQTHGYSPAYYPQAVETLRRFVVDGSTIEEARKAFVRLNGQGSITNKVSATSPVSFAWHLNILNVRTDNAARYCEDVKRWAADVLAVIDKSQP